jgi:amidase
VVTRSVRDTARFFAGAERYYLNPKLPPVGQVSGSGSTRLRVGVLLDSVSGRPVDDETRAAVGDAANLLDKLGHHVSEMAQPADSRLATDFAVYWGFLSFMIATTGRRGLHPEFDRTRLDGFTQGLVGMYRRDYRHTPTVLYRLRRAVGTYRRMFDNYDVVLSPVLGHTLPKLGHLSPNVPFDELLERLMTYVGFTPVNNVCGGPAISLPMAKTAEGLPLGLHFSALHGAERTLLELAYEIEQERPWRRITGTA